MTKRPPPVTLIVHPNNTPRALRIVEWTIESYLFEDRISYIVRSINAMPERCTCGEHWPLIIMQEGESPVLHDQLVMPDDQ